MVGQEGKGLLGFPQQPGAQRPLLRAGTNQSSAKLLSLCLLVYKQIKSLLVLEGVLRAGDIQSLFIPFKSSCLVGLNCLRGGEGAHMYLCLFETIP